MRLTEKLKCPKCDRLILKRILLVTHGKCNNCGYLLVGSINSFLVPKIPSMPNILGQKKI